MNDGVIFNDFFIPNLLLSVKIKEFWRLIRIWQSYGKKIKWRLFSRHGVDMVKLKPTKGNETAIINFLKQQ